MHEATVHLEPVLALTRMKRGGLRGLIWHKPPKPDREISPLLTGLKTSLRSLPYQGFIMFRKFGANQACESGVEKKKTDFMEEDQGEKRTGIG